MGASGHAKSRHSGRPKGKRHGKKRHSSGSAATSSAPPAYKRKDTQLADDSDSDDDDTPKSEAAFKGPRWLESVLAVMMRSLEGGTSEVDGEFIDEGHAGKQPDVEGEEDGGENKKISCAKRMVSKTSRLHHRLNLVANPSKRPASALRILFALFKKKARKRYEMRQVGTWWWSPYLFTRDPMRGIRANRQTFNRIYGAGMDRVIELPIPWTNRTYPIGLGVFLKLIPAVGPTGTLVTSTVKHLMTAYFSSVPFDPILKVPLALLFIERAFAGIPGIGPLISSMFQSDQQITSTLAIYDVFAQLTKEDKKDGWVRTTNRQTDQEEKVQMWRSDNLTDLFVTDRNRTKGKRVVVRYPQAVRELIHPPGACM